MVCSKCGKDKPTSEFNKCKSNKSGYRGQCNLCRIAYSSLYYKEHKEERVAWRKEHYKKNSSVAKAERMKYHYANPEKCSAQAARYRARKLNATPDWLTQDEQDLIQWIYETAIERTLQHGVQFHVDHIIPLQGKDVCGLHVPSNLQVITAEENLSKSNKYEVTFCGIG